MHWAWKQGKEGKNYRQTSQDAADAGTLAHLWSEEYDRGQPLSPPPPNLPVEEVAKAVSGLEAYKRWREVSRYEIVDVEQKLVSEAHRYGGTIDRIFKVGTKLRIGDIKTSGGTYGDHLIQVAAYGNLVRENVSPLLDQQPYPVIEVVIDGYDIIRFGREADFHHSSYPFAAFQKCWDAFKALRLLYDLKGPIERLAG